MRVKMCARILSITLLLILVCVQCSARNLRSPTKRLPSPCCTRASRVNVSAVVIGNTYSVQRAHGRCVKAVIFNTRNARVCINPSAKWAQEVIARMTKV